MYTVLKDNSYSKFDKPIVDRFVLGYLTVQTEYSKDLASINGQIYHHGALS